MTRAEAIALGRRWKQRAYSIPCEHLTLKSDQNREGDGTGEYTCTLCGELFVAQAQERSLAASR